MDIDALVDWQLTGSPAAAAEAAPQLGIWQVWGLAGEPYPRGDS